MSGKIIRRNVIEGFTTEEMIAAAAKDGIVIQESTHDRKIVLSVVIPMCEVVSEENWAKPIIRALALLAKKVWDEYKRRGGR